MAWVPVAAAVVGAVSATATLVGAIAPQDSALGRAARTVGIDARAIGAWLVLVNGNGLGGRVSVSLTDIASPTAFYDPGGAS